MLWCYFICPNLLNGHRGSDSTIQEVYRDLEIYLVPSAWIHATNLQRRCDGITASNGCHNQVIVSDVGDGIVLWVIDDTVVG